MNTKNKINTRGAEEQKQQEYKKILFVTYLISLKLLPSGFFLIEKQQSCISFIYNPSKRLEMDAFFC